MHTIVVGAGAAGLGAAWYLREAGANVTLFEKNADAGGRCRSHRWNEQWLIRGAAAFIGGEDEPVELAKALNIYDEESIVDSQEETHFYVQHGKKGIVELGNFNAPQILKSRLVPAREKLALGAVLPKLLKAAIKHDPCDPTTAVDLDTQDACEYFRKYSPEFVNYILEPVMNQYCGYGENDYSLAWLMWLMGSPRAWSGSAWTFKGRGTGLLTHKLQERFERDPQCNVMLNTEVNEVYTVGRGIAVDYVIDGKTQTLEGDSVVVAIPGSLVNQIMPTLDQERKKFFSEVQYVAHHIYHVIVDKPEADYPFSLLLPTAEGYETVSNIWIKPHGVEGQVMLYGEIKGKFCQENMSLDDQEIIDVAWQDVVRALPQFSGMKIHDYHLQRNDIALCSRRKGYTTSLKQFSDLGTLDRIAFAGDYLINSTVGQSLLSGKQAAQQLLSATTEELRARKSASS